MKLDSKGSTEIEFVLGFAILLAVLMTGAISIGNSENEKETKMTVKEKNFQIEKICTFLETSEDVDEIYLKKFHPKTLKPVKEWACSAYGGKAGSGEVLTHQNMEYFNYLLPKELRL